MYNKKKCSRRGKDILEISNIKYDEDGNQINKVDNYNENNVNETLIIDIIVVKSSKKNF